MDRIGFQVVNASEEPNDRIGAYQRLLVTEHVVEEGVGADDSTGARCPAPRQFLTREETAEYLGMTSQMVFRWANAGRLPCIVIRKEPDAAEDAA